MGALTRWILNLASLAETEARVFRWNAYRMGLALIATLAGAILAVGGIACAAIAAFFLLGYYVGQVGALLIIAAGLLAVGSILIWQARKLTD